MKKLLLILLATALTGSFTSCVENQIPDEVVKIYDNQADLLAAQSAFLQAQASVQAAEATRVAAQAAYAAAQAKSEEARAEAIEIANQYATASNAIELESLRVELERVQAANAAALEQAALNAEISRLNLEKAQAQWAEAVRVAAAAVKASADAAISTAFGNYITAKTILDDRMLSEARQQADIIAQMQKMTDDSADDAVTFAALEDAVVAAEANKASLDVILADYQTMLLPGTTIGDRIALADSYQDQIDANTSAMEDLDLQIAQQTVAVADALAARTATGYNTVQFDFAALQLAYTTAEANVVAEQANLDAVEANITAGAANIANLQDIVTNFDTKVADLEAAIATAAAAEAAADADAATAVADENTAEAAHTAATAATGTANADLIAVTADAAVANASLDTAINAYEAALIAAAAADVAGKQTDLDNANALVVTTQDAYNTAKLIFDAAPLGSTYANGGADGTLGDHSDDGVSVETYAEITVVNPDGTGSFGVLRYTSLADVLAIPGAVSGNAYGAFVQVPDQGLYYDVEADDPAPVPNGDVLAAAADALDAAEAAVPVAQAALTAEMALEDTSVELAAYEAAEDFYDNAVAVVAAQQTVVDTKVAEEAAALAAENAAETAEIAALAAQAAAAAVTVAKTADLTAFNLKTEVVYAAELEAAQVQQDVWEDSLASTQADLDAYLAEAAALVITIDEGPSYSAAQMAANDVWSAATMALGVSNNQDAMLTAENANLTTYIAAITLTEEANINLLITATEADIVLAETAITNAQTAVDNFVNSAIANQTTLTTLEEALEDYQIDTAEQQARVDMLKSILDALL